MDDREIIDGLMARDNEITRQFFYIKCRPLLSAILRHVFNYAVDYREMVNELYDYLMEDNGLKLRQFQYRSSLYQWMKVVTTRFFIRKRNKIINSTSKSSSEEFKDLEEILDPVNLINNQIDVTNLLQLMDNQRYADVIRNLVLNDMEPELYARRIGITVENLYNIKRRAMASLTLIALNHYGYGK